ncbi:MAG: glycosyltransferase [Candidatus Latescibacteria bacterium]|nr:glycosyltransferase [Candidatus Latescibacterota bacterium]
MPEPEPHLSLVVPALNEAQRLARSIPRIRAVLDALDLPGPHEVVVVDDGSEDGTADRARELLRGARHEVVSLPSNRGKGRALKEGMLRARGRVRLFTDADLSTPVEILPRFLAAHRAGFDVVIASRKRPGARVERRQPLLRESMGKIFTFLSALLLVSGVSDFTCGFKSFTGPAADALFGGLRLEDWSYDTEILWRARRLGLRIREVPVRWRDDPSTRVHRLRDTVTSLTGLGRLLLLRHGLSGDPR